VVNLAQKVNKSDLFKVIRGDFMRKAQLQGIIVALILVVALIGLYFIFKGPGMATVTPLEIVISDGAPFPDSFDVRASSAFVYITNDDDIRQEVELRRSAKAGEVGRVVWRSYIRQGDTKTFKVRRGLYAVELVAEEE